MNIRRKNDRLTAWIGVLGLVAVAQASSGAVLYLDSFEGYSIGQTPPAWALLGDGELSVSSPMNHTGIDPMWTTPGFGSTGSKALCLTVDEGAANTSAVFEMPIAGMNQYTLDFSILFTDGMSGTIGVLIFGSESDTVPVVEYSISLLSGHMTVTFTDPDGGTASFFFDSQVGVWTEHMLRMLAGEGPQLYAEPSEITYWMSVPMAGQDFSRIEFSLNTNAGSPGGSLYIDDVALTDCPADIVDDGVLDIFDLFAFLGAFNAARPDADISIDGVWDVFDVFAYLDLFNAGCP